METFRIGITRDFLHDDGAPVWEPLAATLAAGVPGATVEFLPQAVPEMTPDLLQPYDALVTYGCRYPVSAFAGVERLALLARYGVGYDTVDLDAATAAGVAVTITRGAAARPVAEGALTLMLAVSHQLPAKARIGKTAAWHDRVYHTGCELRDRVVATIGFGQIAQELFRLLEPFGLRRRLAYDPYADRYTAARLGVELVCLNVLLAQADFISIHCPLTEETRHLIGAPELAQMKPGAFLINTSRGPVVDQDALYETLKANRIRGAALDVLREEPPAPDEPILQLDNVLITPHTVAVTAELYRDYARSCNAAIRAVAAGRAPEHVVNTPVLESPAFREKLASYAGQEAVGRRQ